MDNGEEIRSKTFSTSSNIWRSYPILTRIRLFSQELATADTWSVGFSATRLSTRLVYQYHQPTNPCHFFQLTIPKFCCAVWHDGIFNIPSFSLQSDILVDDGEYGKSPYPWKNPEGMDQWNPARPDLLRNWKNAPPTIIIHSEKDYRCPITEGLACFHALQAQGVPSRFLTFSDECHWVLSPENSLAWHETVWDWVSRCVNGEIVRGDAEW